MTVTVIGSDFQDIRQQVGMRETNSIKISFRSKDFGRAKLTGCVVDATRCTDDLTPKEFDSFQDALQYIQMIFLIHERLVIGEP